ncbi:MAG TPA: hypothetical protein VGR61_08395 [Candidatus Dormibacteraeota bacterium]|nr:hypothetical protein [Candidatus Dormibacteraeota bacterium]
MAQWTGIDGLIECVSEQMLARSTGAAALSDEARIYLVFGHPLHAVGGGLTGVPAVDAIADAALAAADVQVTWTPGLTAGKSHSLTTADRVVEHLRTRASSRDLPTDAHAAAVDAPMEDLGLRRLMSEWSAAASISAEPVWADVKASICALLETALHRHATGMVESIGRAEPDPRSILLAIERTRAISVRMVSPARVGALLDEAEALVKEKLAAG